jgi:hypothetical protein
VINTIKHLCQELRIEKDELKHILANSERYYYQVLSTKTKYGGPQKKNGVERTRTLYPSTGELKDLQRKF